MDVTYQFAWKEGNTALYMDASDCKYAAKNGNLAWRINNPGLVKHHCRFAKKNGSIGAWEKLAIFSNPLQGHQALKKWLHSKTMLQSDLYGIGKHYQPTSPEQFAQSLASSSGIPPKTKLKDLTQAEFEILLTAIEKLCGFLRIGNEEFLLLPKIAARIECPEKEDLYLIGKDLTLTKKEAINWITSHRLDGVVVHHSNGDIHLRSRPRYRMQTLKLTWEQHCEAAGELELLARIVGEKTKEQCVWGFINGIRNTRENAIESANLISTKAGNEQVVLLQNDRFLQGAKEIGVAILLKIGIDTPIVKNAVQFFRYLLSMSEGQYNSPVVIFAHSQGAAIAEHAIALLSNEERQKIRIFTFGGWSFIPPGITHTESHNYASVGDLIPRVGSFNLQYIALRKYEGLKEGLNHEQIIRRLAFGDAIHDLDCLEPHVLERYTQDRCKHYRNEFEKISNVTVLDSGSMWEHSFNNESYQNIVRKKIEKYRKDPTKITLIDSQELLVESFV
jgi:ribosomal protein S13